jgi:hypothetical protein
VSLDSVAARAAAAGARVRTRSRWLHAVSVAAPTAALRALARDRVLRRIQPSPLGPRRAPGDHLPEARAPTADTCPAGGDPVFGASGCRCARLTSRAHRPGLTGAGVRIAPS